MVKAFNIFGILCITILLLIVGCTAEQELIPTGLTGPREFGISKQVKKYNVLGKGHEPDSVVEYYIYFDEPFRLRRYLAFYTDQIPDSTKIIDYNERASYQWCGDPFKTKESAEAMIKCMKEHPERFRMNDY